ncbi:hypothetical protein V8C86DRAFT_2516575 [Haematococcus lacustris]
MLLMDKYVVLPGSHSGAILVDSSLLNMHDLNDTELAAEPDCTARPVKSRRGLHAKLPQSFVEDTSMTLTFSLDFGRLAPRAPAQQRTPRASLPSRRSQIGSVPKQQQQQLPPHAPKAASQQPHIHQRLSSHLHHGSLCSAVAETLGRHLRCMSFSGSGAPPPTDSARSSSSSMQHSTPWAAGPQGIMWPVLPCMHTAEFLTRLPCPRGQRYFANQQGEVVTAGASRVHSPLNRELLRWAGLLGLPHEQQPILDLMPMLQPHDVQVGINPFAFPPPAINPTSCVDYMSCVENPLADLPSSFVTSFCRHSSCSHVAQFSPGTSSSTPPACLVVSAAPPPEYTAPPADMLLLAKQYPEEVGAAMRAAVAAGTAAAVEAAAQLRLRLLFKAEELRLLQLAQDAAVAAVDAGMRACAAAEAAGQPGPSSPHAHEWMGSRWQSLFKL